MANCSKMRAWYWYVCCGTRAALQQNTHTFANSNSMLIVDCWNDEKGRKWQPPNIITMLRGHGSRVFGMTINGSATQHQHCLPSPDWWWTICTRNLPLSCRAFYVTSACCASWSASRPPPLRRRAEDHFNHCYKINRHIFLFFYFASLPLMVLWYGWMPSMSSSSNCRLPGSGHMPFSFI